MAETVSFASNGATASGYLVRPKSGSGPGVLVIQEWWGLDSGIKEMADRLAAAGFVALAPDLYHGETTKSPDEAGKMMMALRIDEAEKELRGAVQYLAGHATVEPRKIGTIGFCMGGALSLFAASKNPEVDACVVFYGGHPNVKPDLPNLRAPVLGIYAEKDTFVSQDVVRQLDTDLKKLGKRHEFHTYPGVDHAFFNETGKNYDAASASDAWRRAVEFLTRELK